MRTLRTTRPALPRRAVLHAGRRRRVLSPLLSIPLPLTPTPSLVATTTPDDDDEAGQDRHYNPPAVGATVQDAPPRSPSDLPLEAAAPAATHALAAPMTSRPCYEAVFGIAPAELRDPRFLARLRRQGLGPSCGDAESGEGPGEVKQKQKGKGKGKHK